MILAVTALKIETNHFSVMLTIVACSYNNVIYYGNNDDIVAILAERGRKGGPAVLAGPLTRNIRMLQLVEQISL